MDNSANLDLNKELLLLNTMYGSFFGDCTRGFFQPPMGHCRAQEDGGLHLPVILTILLLHSARGHYGSVV